MFPRFPSVMWNRKRWFVVDRNYFDSTITLGRKVKGDPDVPYQAWIIKEGIDESECYKLAVLCD